jgi:hypothetical protein
MLKSHLYTGTKKSRKEKEELSPSQMQHGVIERA